MKNKVVEVPSIKQPIQLSPGFAKKKLSDYKLDILGLCGFGCRYCSSNEGNYLRINRARFAQITQQQIGEEVLPAEDPALMFVWPNVLERLDTQLQTRQQSWGEGQTLVFSMLTDGFSPELVKQGVTEAALRMVLERTSFRVRILTKNAIVGTKHWLAFFKEYQTRVVVGLSVGTLDAQWARNVEIGASLPDARLRALHSLQDSGIPTYGMLCPMFPDLLEGDAVERLVNQIRPELTEHVWAEPYNDRNNWRIVRDGYSQGSKIHQWFTNVFEGRKTEMWSQYATQLYLRLRAAAEAGGWIQKLRYLLYEQSITAHDAATFRGLRGVLLQSAPDANGRSRNPYIAHEQTTNYAEGSLYA